jgi:hypothetical protein
MNNPAAIKKCIPANGLRGQLLYSCAGTYVFRIYDKDYSFKDYDLRHSDLSVIIDDVDAFLYEHIDGGMGKLDHSPETLGFI